METRYGSIHPGLILELVRQGYGQADLSRLLQSESGMKELSDLSGDMREIRETATTDDQGAVFALDVFATSCLDDLGQKQQAFKEWMFTP